MLDLDNDEVFEAALLASLGAPIRPEVTHQPAGDLRAHLGDLVSQELASDFSTAEVSQCPDPVGIPVQGGFSAQPEVVSA